MKPLLPLLGIVVSMILAGCATSTKYEIDVKCPNSKLNFAEYDEENGVKKYVCFKNLPSFETLFVILCDQNTVQEIGNAKLCTTHDGQKVRIRVE